MKARRSLTERLATQKALVGLLYTRANITLAELAGHCGYDFLLIDVEHGIFTDHECLQALRACSAMGMLSMIRLSGQELGAIGRYLDMGADVIVAPNVRTAAEADVLAKAMVYPPVGTRGFGASIHRETNYGIDLTLHIEAPRGGAAFLAVIESAQGVENIDSILAVDGLDGIIVGPGDLSSDLGRPLDFSQAAYAPALARVEHSAAARRKVLGTAPHGDHTLEALRARGHRVFIVGSDISLVRDAMCAQVKSAQDRL
jgi:4-hydroxy-2-oxoheptanedioate aldolase